MCSKYDLTEVNHHDSKKFIPTVWYDKNKLNIILCIPHFLFGTKYSTYFMSKQNKIKKSGTKYST